jgi:cytochrome c-type biogenesis protein CcmF
VNPGAGFTWVALVSALAAGIGWLVASRGRTRAMTDTGRGAGSCGAARFARFAFRVQWLALVAASAFLLLNLFRHDFRYVYVASYSSLAMSARYVVAAFWGGQGGTFLLWALLTATLGLVLLRQRHPLAAGAAAFLTLPLVFLEMACLLRGPFATFAPGAVPPDGQGLNPLLQNFWMIIHPPVLFLGYAALTVPFALAMTALVRRDWDGWVRPALPWVGLSSVALAAGIVMGGVWAYEVLGWGGYWGWDPVENGSLVPWLVNIALLHGLLVQRAGGHLRRTNLALALSGYGLVVYASYLTRSGVLADFSVHSFADEGLTGFLLLFLAAVLLAGLGALAARLRAVPAPAERMADVSREMAMLLGALVLVALGLLVAVGMSAPLIQRALGRSGGVQASYYDGVSGPAAVLLGLLLGLAPLTRWGRQEVRALLRAAWPSLALAALLTAAVVAAGLRDALQVGIVFTAAFALAANGAGMVRGFGGGWRHGLAALAHAGVALLLVGIVVSSGLGRSAGVVLREGEPREVLGYRLTFEGMRPGADGHDRARIAVAGSGGEYVATPAIYWSESNRGTMMTPHIRRSLAGDVYLAPVELLGRATPAGEPVWLAVGESSESGGVRYRLLALEPAAGEVMRIVAQVEVESYGRHDVLQPALEIDMRSHEQRSVPDCLPDGGELSVVAADPMTGRVALQLPAGAASGAGGLAVELSTKPLIGLLWLGASLMLAGAFLAMLRRAGDASAEPRPTRH